MDLHLRIIGTLLLLLALLHAIFPRYFNWREELSSLSLINREMMYVHTFFIALAVFLMGLACLMLPQELRETRLGRYVSLGLGIFWAARLAIQLFGYSVANWKGKRLETSIHVGFLLLWAYLSTCFLVIYMG